MRTTHPLSMQISVKDGSGMFDPENYVEMAFRLKQRAKLHAFVELLWKLDLCDLDPHALFWKDTVV